jgi:hypothetical protein
MVTGSGFGESSLPQNLGSGQKVEDQPPSWGSVGSHRRVGKIFSKWEEIHAECGQR